MSGDEIESLVVTRKKRSNAGSRLKQLLQAEEIANEGDEDDDIDLLFQEDDDDAEFQVGDKDKYGYTGSNDEDEGEEEQEGEASEVERSDEESQREGTTSVRETTANSDSDEEGPQVDLDDMFSDSEDDDSDEEESDEGERELQKQERAKKRQAQKKSRQIPKIITKPKPTTPKKKKVQDAPKADTLLSLNRRQSSRKTAVRSKMDLVERLKENEQRRQSIKPVAKVEYVELTQEERLAEAIETEKYNISTLNKYKEQEIDKKKKQRALQLSRRKKLTNVVSFISCPIFVTPVEEHELEQFLMTRDTLKRKRDRRGRKSEKQKREEEELRLKEEARKKRAEMFIIRPKSPSQESEASKGVVMGNVDGNADGKSSTEATTEVKADDTPKQGVLESEIRNDDSEENEKKRPLATDAPDYGQTYKRLKTEGDESLVSLENDENTREGTKNVVNKLSEAVDAQTEQINKDARVEDKEKKLEQDQVVSNKDPEQTSAFDAVPADTDKETSQDGNPPIEESKVEDADAEITPNREDKMDVDTEEPTIKAEGEDIKLVKSGKFADEEESKFVIKDETTQEPSLEPSSSREVSVIQEEESIVFAGPPQKVGANFISFEKSVQNYTVDEIKAYLFGPQSLSTGFRKSQEVEPILRMRADVLLKDDDNSINKEDLPSFEFLDSFPKFGEFNKVRKEQVLLETREDIKVVLKTQPPTGVHLPNGSKKQCLITGKPAMYFDPKTGLPYGNVEAYKVIKDIQNGNWAWTEFPGGGAYVCNRENTVHANGVPEGFDVLKTEGQINL